VNEQELRVCEREVMRKIHDPIKNQDFGVGVGGRGVLNKNQQGNRFANETCRYGWVYTYKNREW